MAMVEILDAQQIDRRRQQLLERAGLPLDELRRRAEEYSLSDEQVAILDEIDDLDFVQNS